MQITRIPAERQDSTSLQKKLRVAYYPRVSSKSFEQLQSLNNMITDAKKEAADNNWELVDIYADEGISGISASNRPQLNRLLKDCREGKIDRVIIKSVSRLGRNVKELLEIGNSLRETGVAIFFDTDRIDTANGYDPLMFSIKGLIAETESRNISQNMQWSVRRRFQNGTYIQSKDPYGYYHDAAYKTHIEPYEGKVVKLIFKKALEGHGTETIAKYLNDEHFLTRSYSPWCKRTVVYILRNPAYTGNPLWQKRFTEPDVFPYHLVVNNGELPQYVASQVYDPLISKEDFEAVQVMLNYESYKLGFHENPNKCLKRYLFSERIKCKCGSSVNRKITHGIVKWACKRHARDIKSCPVKAMREDCIKQAFIRMRNRLCTNIYLLEDLYKEMGRYRKVAEVENQVEKNKEVIVKLAKESDLYNKLYVQNLVDSAFYIQKMKDLDNEAQQCYGINNKNIEEEIRINETRRLIQHLKQKEPIREWFDPTEFDELVKQIKIIDNETISFMLINDLELEEKVEVVK